MLSLILAVLLSPAHACSPSNDPCRIDTSHNRTKIVDVKVSAPKALRVKTQSEYSQAYWSTSLSIEAVGGPAYAVVKNEWATAYVDLKGEHYSPIKFAPGVDTQCALKDGESERVLKIGELAQQEWECIPQATSCGDPTNGHPAKLYFHSEGQGWIPSERQAPAPPKKSSFTFLVNGKIETISYTVTTVRNENYLKTYCTDRTTFTPENPIWSSWRTVVRGRYTVEFRVWKLEGDDPPAQSMDKVEQIIGEELDDLMEVSKGEAIPEPAVIARLRNRLSVDHLTPELRLR